MTTEAKGPKNRSVRCTCSIERNSHKLQDATALWNTHCDFCRTNRPPSKKTNRSHKKQEAPEEEFEEIDAGLLKDCAKCGPIWLCQCIDADLSLPFDHKRDQEFPNVVETLKAPEKEELNLIWDPMSDGASETLRQWARQDRPVVKEEEEVGYIFLDHRQ